MIIQSSEKKLYKCIFLVILLTPFFVSAIDAERPDFVGEDEERFNNSDRERRERVIVKPEQDLSDRELRYYYSRIIVGEDKFIINYSETGKEITYSSEWFNVDRLNFAVEEIDPFLGQELTVVDSNVVKLKIFPNPNLPSRLNERLHIGLVSTNLDSVIIGRRSYNDLLPYRRDESDALRNDVFTKFYELPRIPYNQEITLVFSDTPQLFAWWLGEGQGGIGGGCDYVYTSISLNQTQTYVNDTFLMGAKWQQQGSGCNAHTLYWEQYNDANTWKSISQYNVSGTNVNCNGVLCERGSPAINTWYYKEIQCDRNGTRFLRTRVTSSYTSYPTPSWSNQISCLDKPKPESDDSGIVWLSIFMVFSAGYYLLNLQGKKKKAKRDEY